MRVLIAICFCLMSIGLLPSAEAGIIHHWIQLVPGKQDADLLRRPDAMVRAIVEEDDACPILESNKYALSLVKVGSSKHPGHDRPKPEGEGFDKINLCELRLPATHVLVHDFTEVTLNIEACIRSKKQVCKVPLTLPNLALGAPLSKMVLFGCTGCRSKASDGKPKKDGKNKDNGEDDKQDDFCKISSCSSPACKQNENQGQQNNDEDGQVCDTQHWPFSEINTWAEQETRDGIAPIVVHLGDMRYSAQKKAKDLWKIENPSKNWEVDETPMGWEEEFFDPVAPLMKHGYWIMLRGNHEACLSEKFRDGSWMVKKKNPKKDMKDRGVAWFYFFSHDEKISCDTVGKKDMDNAYAIDAKIYDKERMTDKEVRLVVMDTVRTGDDRDRQCLDSKVLYEKQFDEVNRFVVQSTEGPQKPVWLLSHMPFYNVKGGKFRDTVLLDALLGSDLESSLDKIAISFASHRHLFQFYSMKLDGLIDKPLAQYVIGNSGIGLSEMNEATEPVCQSRPFCWSPVGGGAAKQPDAFVLQQRKFGYLLVDFNRHGEARFMPRFIAGPDQESSQAADLATCYATANGLVCPAFNTSATLPTCPAGAGEQGQPVPACR